MESWPKLDLARHRMLRLAVAFRVLDLDLADVAEQMVQGDEGLIHVAARKYRRSSFTHATVENVWLIDEAAKTFEVDVEYLAASAVPDGPIPRELGRFGVTRSLLSQDVTIDHSTVNVELILPEEVSPWSVRPFPLPFPISESFRMFGGDPADVPVDEIRGFRGVKLKTDGTGEPLYSFTLDRPSNGAIRITLQWEEDHPTNPLDTPHTVLQRSVAIARSLVRTNSE